MSISLVLDPNNAEDIKSVLGLLEKFEKQIEAAEPIFVLEGKKLIDIAKTLPMYQASYDQSCAEVRELEDWMMVVLERKSGELWKKFNEGYSRQLTQKDIGAYIAADADMLTYKAIYASIVGVKEKLKAIVDALRQMGFMVKNMTDLRVNELQEVVL